MGKSKEVISTYTPFVTDRAKMLDKTSRAYNGVDGCIRDIKKKYGKASFRVRVIDEAQSRQSGLIVSQELTIDPQFHFGMWLIQKSIIEDLAEEGELDTAMDILDHNGRRK